MESKMPPLAVSSWSYHRTLGAVRHQFRLESGRVQLDPDKQVALPLLELPALVASMGIPILEICHFHLPSVETTYLATLRRAIEEAGLSLAYLLIDMGDLSSDDASQRELDIEYMKHWQQVAASLGADGVRIGCGFAPPAAEVYQAVGERLRMLEDYAQSLGLHVITENWQETAIAAPDLLAIVEQSQRPIGVCLDTGNAHATQDRYATIAALAPHATSIHLKGDYPDGNLDVADLRHSLTTALSPSFDGHITLIYDTDAREEEQLALMKQLVEEYFSAA